MVEYSEMFRLLAKYLALWWAKYAPNLMFLDINWKGFHPIHFKPCLCANWVSIHKWFYFRPNIYSHGGLKMGQIWSFLTLPEKGVHSIHFKYFWCANWVSVQNFFFIFGTVVKFLATCCQPIFLLTGVFQNSYLRDSFTRSLFVRACSGSTAKHHPHNLMLSTLHQYRGELGTHYMNFLWTHAGSYLVWPYRGVRCSDGPTLLQLPTFNMVIRLEGPEDPHRTNSRFLRSRDPAHASLPLTQTPWGLTGRAWLQAGAQQVAIVVSHH